MGDGRNWSANMDMDVRYSLVLEPRSGLPPSEFLHTLEGVLEGVGLREVRGRLLFQGGSRDGEYSSSAFSEVAVGDADMCQAKLITAKDVEVSVFLVLGGKTVVRAVLVADDIVAIPELQGYWAVDLIERWWDVTQEASRKAIISTASCPSSEEVEEGAVRLFGLVSNQLVAPPRFCVGLADEPIVRRFRSRVGEMVGGDLFVEGDAFFLRWRSEGVWTRALLRQEWSRCRDLVVDPALDELYRKASPEQERRIRRSAREFLSSDDILACFGEPDAIVGGDFRGGLGEPVYFCYGSVLEGFVVVVSVDDHCVESLILGLPVG